MSKPNKADKMVARLAEQMKGREPEQIYSYVYNELSIKFHLNFDHRRLGVEYRTALTQLREKLGIWEYAAE